MAGETLLGIMRGVARETSDSRIGTELIYARVLSLNPVRLQLSSGLEISEEFIALSALCGRLTANDGTVIFAGLEEGQPVRVLKCGGGQLYYVIEPA